VNNPEQLPTSQVEEENIGNEAHREVDMIMDNEDKPEQVLTSQVVEANTVDKDRGNMDITVDNKNMDVVSRNEDKSEQVPTSQVAGVVNMDEVHADVKVSEDNPEEVGSRQAVEMVVFFNSFMSRDVIDSDVLVVGISPRLQRRC
jgi:hypothetical protein